MEQTAGPLPTDDVSHVVYLGEEAAPLFPLAEHCELPSISADVLKSILTEEQGYPAQSVVIVDSRHHFEYEGGHIKGAVNLRDPSAIEEFYSRNINVGKQIAIVFHCEFSSSRAPKLFKHMRNLDRLAHMETYPELAFPNMFLLKGGYKAFFELYSELCVPREYVKMSDPKFVDHLRVSSSSLKRSWNQRSKDFINSHCGDRDEPLIDVSNVQQKEKYFAALAELDPDDLDPRTWTKDSVPCFLTSHKELCGRFLDHVRVQMQNLKDFVIISTCCT